MPPCYDRGTGEIREMAQMLPHTLLPIVYPRPIYCNGAMQFDVQQGPDCCTLSLVCSTAVIFLPSKFWHPGLLARAATTTTGALDQETSPAHN